MVISASRRTDIPAFYTPWLLGRINAGFCEVPNPYRASQVKRVSLLPDDVDVLVLWTKQIAPMLDSLQTLKGAGYRLVIQHTLNDYEPARELGYEPNIPPLNQRVWAFLQASEILSPECVIWRYDPIIISEKTPTDCHLETFAAIARRLNGAVRRVHISLLDPYPGIKRWMEECAGRDDAIRDIVRDSSPAAAEELNMLMTGVASIARENGMEIFTCAEEADYPVPHGACIDPAYLNRLFGLGLAEVRDEGQRGACHCAPSVDIGQYDCCPAGCGYCYANHTGARVPARIARHDPGGGMLIPGT